MTGLRVTPEELKSLLVDQLGVIEPSEFEKAQKMAARLRVPLERSLVEQGLSRKPSSWSIWPSTGAWATSSSGSGTSSRRHSGRSAKITPGRTC